MLGAKNRQIKDLQYQVHQATKQYNDTIRVYAARIHRFFMLFLMLFDGFQWFSNCFRLYFVLEFDDFAWTRSLKRLRRASCSPWEWSPKRSASRRFRPPPR